MPLTKQNLIKTFNGAREYEAPFVFVGIEAEGIREVITVPAISFDAKEQFYTNAYSDDLVHVMNSKVRVFGLTYGNADAVHDLV
ncbi:hypothetical protein [Lysinibacillus pakistanensis]|uniref:Uncharacterized protein n=1 Tax=Lysinibacillus pakistanensis TaxID=759811 RepID=A0AAX3WYF6_9BACI|nr:hypothetical protein [Lysinibacillus pakistanensis]MDM5231474.1 hypothetical protein [Lysinibacillus pakistanensis]WHY47021.1 hypothetical protein QNH22_02035 [Lysinibacillus pakistanensis]WHY52033.1 hypothetical protein QNH24_02030 [Lysinibacillus pakistanensis]